MLKVSLPLIGLFVCLFLLAAEKSFCRTEDKRQSMVADKSEEQRLKVMAVRSGEINSLLDRAIVLYKNKQFEEAIDLFNQVIRLDPQNASAYFSLGITLEANKDLAGAANNYAIAHEIDPANPQYQKALLSLKVKMENESQMQSAEAKQQSLATQAASAFKLGEYEQALSLYQSLEKENPHLAFAKYNIGTIYLILKKPNDALNYYKEAHKLEPENKQYSDSLEKLKENIKQVQVTKKAEKTKNAGQTSSAKDNEKELANQSVMKNILAYLGLRVKSAKDGVLITAILSNSRAAQAGLEPGDLIKVIDGQAIKKANQLEKTLQSKPLGQRFQLLVVRQGRTGQVLF